VRHPDVRLRAAAPHDQKLLEDLTRLREEHNWLYKKLYGHRIDRAAEGDLAKAEADGLQAQVRSREKDIARVLERIALRSDDSVRDTIQPLSEDSAARLPLTGRAVLLEFYLRERDGIAFIVSTQGIESTVSLPIGSVQIRRLLAFLHLAFEATARLAAVGASTTGPIRSAQGILASLYRALIEPVAEHVAGADRLVIVPYGPLHGVPFAALYDGTGYLVERVELSTCPSSRLLRVCASRPARTEGTALVLANTNGGQLEHVLREAESGSALVPGETYLEQQATREALIQSARKHAIVHLAAHGEARLDNPQFAYLQLADGQLSTVDVFNLDLHGTLVTLSGCETGRVSVGAGDELIGLTRGFLHAGASTFLQSLWRVNDEVTAGFMGHFYRGLRRGQATGGALRAAMLEVMRSSNGDPFLWAPFQLVGDAERIWSGSNVYKETGERRRLVW
jgi:hypothetical protein